MTAKRERDYLTPPQIAEELQVALRTVQFWLTKGELEGYRVGRNWRVDPDNLKAFLQRFKGRQAPLHHRVAKLEDRVEALEKAPGRRARGS